MSTTFYVTMAEVPAGENYEWKRGYFEYATKGSATVHSFVTTERKQSYHPQRLGRTQVVKIEAEAL